MSKKTNNQTIAGRLRQLAEKLETAAPLIDGTAEGRALAQQAVAAAAAELKEIITSEV